MHDDRTTPPPPAATQGSISDLHSEVERVFEDFVRGWPFRVMSADGTSPRVDMTETESAVEITAELPGLSERDIEVSVNGQMLRISGEKKSETKLGAADVHLMERSYGRFARTLALPFAPDPGTVEASFTNGILTLTVPKPAGLAAETRTIPVKRKG